MNSQNPNPPNLPNTPNNTGGFKLDGRTILIIGVIILAAVIFLPQLLNGNNATNTQATVNAPINHNPSSGQSASNVQLGEFVAATTVDADNCPINASNSFSRSDSIYVGVANSNIPAGTRVFARLFRNGQAVEDTDEITADSTYSCAAFVFEPSAGAEVFETGNYEAQLFVNGNPGNRISFTVR